MKHIVNILLTILAALSLTCSCAQHIDPIVMGASERLISFEKPLLAPATKALSDFSGTGSFDVYAQYYSNTTNFATIGWTGASAYMDRVAVTQHSINADGGHEGYLSWYPENSYFWPKQGQLAFQAYAPSAVASSETGQLTHSVASVGETGVSFLGYIVPTILSQQQDLLYSDRVADLTENSVRAAGTAPDTYSAQYGVQLTFYHALANVKFSAKTAAEYHGTTIKVKSIVLSGLKNQGNFSQALTNTTVGKGSNENWTVLTEDAEHNPIADISYSNSVIPAGEGALIAYEANTNDFTPIFVLPQDFASDADAKITITYTIQSGSGTPITQVKEQLLKDLTYGGGEDKKFEMGKQYTFNITIALNKIYFAPVVNNWTDINVSDIAS